MMLGVWLKRFFLLLKLWSALEENIKSWTGNKYMEYQVRDWIYWPSLFCHKLYDILNSLSFKDVLRFLHLNDISTLGHHSLTLLKCSNSSSITCFVSYIYKYS